MSSSNPHPSAGIAKALHDLQGEIQSFGSGPYTAEQQQKMNQYNLLFQKATATPESAQYIKRPPGSSPPLVIMSSPSTTQVQVQTSSANQPVVMTTSNLRGVTSVIPQGAVLMQQAIATSIANQMTGSNQSSQSSPSKGQPTTGTTQIQIKPNNVGTTMSNPNPTIQRQVLPVQAIPAGHTPVQMVASISGHQTQGGHVLTAVNLPQGHTLGQRTIAPQGIAIQQQGTPLVIQVTAAHTGQGKPTFVQASGKMVGSVVQQSGSNDSLKTPITATPKVTQNHDSLNAAEPQSVLSRKRLQDLLQEIDPRATLDEDVEDVLLQIADDFIESVVSASCQIAKHRQSNTLEARDIQMHLERNWNMWIPGYGTEDFKQSKKLGSTEAHKQRMALIRKSMKK
ncbi:transcription initiation factor TFIID subunit 12-like isoform X2 [Xenia sp. Carnegie-2017]|uniref:transcription initiation factor TFIID subunit 12-like isoform X2 n=1 Tax=Xenia sp. Carnegie-2017 TaxID=2897299 RepID=UPI001F040FE7|nr:transcription initiation factor TFIID subunit 12-like isoform X2 [Xenia sp. Carnegie-2017]